MEVEEVSRGYFCTDLTLSNLIYEHLHRTQYSIIQWLLLISLGLTIVVISPRPFVVPSRNIKRFWIAFGFWWDVWDACVFPLNCSHLPWSKDQGAMVVLFSGMVGWWWWWLWLVILRFACHRNTYCISATPTVFHSTYIIQHFSRNFTEYSYR